MDHQSVIELGDILRKNTYLSHHVDMMVKLETTDEKEERRANVSGVREVGLSVEVKEATQNYWAKKMLSIIRALCVIRFSEKLRNLAMSYKKWKIGYVKPVRPIM